MIKLAIQISISWTLLVMLSSSGKLINQPKNIYDTPATDISRLFEKENVFYHIRNDYTTIDTIRIPQGCTIIFEGGSISAPLIFDNTRLDGNVNLKGSSLMGSIANEVFDASWICNMDGETDDATNINQIINVANSVFFPKGNYYLRSVALPSSDIPDNLHNSIRSHIGINKSNLRLYGEEGSCLISRTPIIMLSIYSKPNDIENSISDILISNLHFIEANDKKTFHEFSHTIKVVGVNRLSIQNCIFDDFWGDGICLSHYGDFPSTGERTRNQNVNIMNNIFYGFGFNNGDAISVVNGKNICIINNEIEQVSKREMPGAIDIEANNRAYTLEDITIAYNRINGSNGFGGAVSVVSQNNAPAHRIRIDHNIISNSTYGLAFYVRSDYCMSEISITNNIIDKNTVPYRFEGDAKTKRWIVSNNNLFSEKHLFGGKIKIEDLRILE